MRPGDPNHGTRGFALIEALASLVVVGMISLMLIQGMVTGRRVWRRIDTGEAGGEVVDVAQSTLRDRIEQTYPATLYDENPPYADFNGAADGVIFLATPPQAGRPAPLRRYHLALSTAGNLILSSVSDLAPPGARAFNQFLLGGVRELDIAYFGAAAPDQIPRWRSVWRDQAAPPQLVRVRVGFEPGDRRQWPDLIIRPTATIDTACLFNAVTRHCKGRA